LADKNNKKQEELTIQIPLTIKQLELFIGTTLTYNDTVTKQLLRKIRELVSNINKKDYDDDIELASRLWLLKGLLKYRLKNGLKTYDELIEAVSVGKKYEDEIDTIIECVNDIWYEDDNGLCKEDILYVDELVSDILQYSFIFKYQDTIDDLSIKLRSGDYGDSLHDFCDIYRNTITNLYSSFKKSEAMSKESENDFNSNDFTLETAVGRSIKQLNAPSNKLKTSVRMKNEMLNGGYESGRFYLVLGLQGGGKSVELIQIALDMKHYNKDLQLENNKKPVILFITQENSIRETIERFWSYYMGNSDDFKSHSTEEAMKILNEKGFSKGPSLLVKYRSSKSISTTDVGAMIEEIEEDGENKVIAVIHDYIKRIRSSQYSKSTSNMYEELGDISDEFCSLAKEHDIVVVSAMQFNRNALQKIEEAIKKNKDDPLKTLGTSDIGESVKILDNSDVIYSIHRKTNPLTDETMISYKLMKYRGKRATDAPEYFSHPFEDGNTMKLKPDLHLSKSLSVVDLGNGLEKFDPVQNRKDRKEKAAQEGKTIPGGRVTVDRNKRANLLKDDDADEEE